MKRSSLAFIAAVLFGIFASPSLAQPGAPPSSDPPLAPRPASAAPPAEVAPGDVATSQAAPAQSPSQERVDELARRVDVLAEELERLRSAEVEAAELSEARRRALGLAPSAAAAYRKKQGVSLAGYGEMLLENGRAEDQSGRPGGGAQLDFLRMILYTGYRFSERFLFNAEVEFEHANEASVEFAYVDAMLHERATLRAGMVLVPLGLINEFHEPTVFLGARRTETETRIIPSTWRENGAGVLGSAGPFNYRLFVVSGFNAAGFGPEGLRGGRQKGSRSRVTDPGIAARVDLTPANGVLVGGAVFSGGADQGQYLDGGVPVDVSTVIVEAHSQVQIRGLDVKALFARTSVDGAGELNRLRNLPSGRAVAEQLQGAYVQAGYNVLAHRSTRFALTPYYRLEAVDTQHRMPEGYAPDLARRGTFHTFGIEFRPVPGVVLKTDYQIVRNDARSGRDQFNVNLGYAF
jgi:hypothetical protein